MSLESPGMIKRIYRFMRHNEYKKMTIEAYLLSAFFRYQMLHENTKKLYVNWGIAGKEAPQDITLDEYKEAQRVSYVVNRVCDRTKWDSKCLVRALTAQRLLAVKGIESTLYLGCKEDEKHKLIAHAWIRCGRMFVTGGDGRADGYAIVEKFKARL